MRLPASSSDGDGCGAKMPVILAVLTWLSCSASSSGFVAKGGANLPRRHDCPPPPDGGVVSSSSVSEGRVSNRDEEEATSLSPPQERHELGTWVPVGSASSLSGLDPVGIEIMGRNFVVWRSSSSKYNDVEWSVLNDECPHRKAPLSLGRIDCSSSDPVVGQPPCRIECPYHGWQFDGQGTLRRIPLLENGGKLPVDAGSVASHPVHVTGDLIWVFLPTAYHGESFPASVLPENYYFGLNYMTNRNATYYTQELPYSFDFVCENSLDAPGHAYFAHHGSGFDRKQAKPVPCKVPISNFTDLVTEVSYTRGGQDRSRRFTFQRPFLFNNLEPVSGGAEWRPRFLFFTVPVREGRARIISTLDIFSPHPATPDWLTHVINLRFLEGDLITHNCEIQVRRDDSVMPNYVSASSSDVSCTAWRTWWLKYGMSSAPRNTFGPASAENLVPLTRKELVDPWTSHVQRCSKCRTVLRRCKIVQKFGWVILWTAATLFRRKAPIRSLALALVGLVSSLVAGLLVRELEGVRGASDVADRARSAMK